MPLTSNLNGAAEQPAAGRPGSRFARNIPVYYLFYGSSGFLIWMPIWMIYLLDGRGMSLTQVATMEMFFWITLVIAEVPTGAIADRWGRRVSLFLGGVGFTAASVVFAFSGTYALLAVSYLVMAVSMTLYSGAGHALLFDTLRQLRRSNEYEKHVGRSEAAAFTAMVAAILLGGPITALVGFTNTILIGAAAMAVSASIALLLREPPRREAEFAPRNGQTAAPAAAAPQLSVLGNMLAGAFVVWRRKTLLAIILFATLLFVVLEMPALFLQTFVRFQGIDPRGSVDSGFVFSVLLIPPTAGMVVGSLLAVGVARRFGERRALPLLMLAAVVFFLPLVAWDSLWVIPAIAVLAAIRGTIRPIATGYINRRIPSDQRATVLSMFELSAGLMMALLTPAVGSVADASSFQWAFALCLALLLVLGGLFGAAWRRTHAREQARTGIRLNSVPKPQATISRARSSAAAAAVKPNDASSASLS